MPELISQIAEAAKAMSAWEVAAVIFALAYLILAIRQNLACWAAAIISTSIYVVLMFRAGLMMESALQVFYIIMAVYGWYSWTHGTGPDKKLLISSWPLQKHVVPVAVILVATGVSGYLLSSYTDAAMPYLDSLTTWGAVFSTWLVARKIIQNWHYWFVIDSLSVYLYLNRGLYLTAALFVLYLVLIVIGLRQWRKNLNDQIA
jgi:nicotinamide mononucleotide transporter